MIESKKIKNPFPGLRPFETEEYRLFFGREGQSDALISRLQRSHFLAVVGTSGSGKSSLVRAGLLPAVRGGMMDGSGCGWRIAIMRPGSDPFGNLAHSLAAGDVLPEAGGGLPPAEAEAAIEAQLRSGSLGLVDTAKNARLAEPDKLLVLVDQFEELFRFRAARAATGTGDEAAAFVKLLLEAAQQRDLSIYVVLTMRSDFLGDCAQFQGLPEAINDGQYLIPRMTRDERRIAIAGPVGVTRGKMAEPLINRLLNDVGDNPDQLPILQHALMRTWDYWAAHRNGEPIGLEHYEAIGTMSEALSLHADEAWGELPDDRRHVAEKLFKALTEKGTDNREIRRPTRLSEIAAGAEVTEAEVVAVADVFRGEGRSFLMPSGKSELRSDTVIDISHESLIRNWDRLQKWVDEEAVSARIYRRLAEAAVLHREGGEGLLQDPALQIGLDWRNKEHPNAAWAGRYHPGFAEAMTFLDDSKTAHQADLAAKQKQREDQLARERRELEMARDFADKQARAAGRMRWLTAGMAVMFVLAMVTAGFAVYARGLAVEAKQSAIEAKKGVEVEKEKVAQALKDTEGRRKEAALALQSKVEADEARDAAELEKNRQLKKALDAEEFAKKEAARANAEKVKADENLAKAEANAAEFKAAVERNGMLREGLEAFRRGNYIEALNDFEKLKTELQSLQPGSSAPRVSGQTRSPDQARQFMIDLGWTNSRIGTTQRLMKDPGKAREAFEKALEVLKILTDRGDPISKDPLMFETYFGLAHAYHEGGAKGGDPQAATTESERYLKQALKFQQNRAQDLRKELAKLSGPETTPQQLALRGEIVKAEEEVAHGFSELAHLYHDVSNGPDAEKNYINAVDHLRKEKADPAKVVAALRELGAYYLEVGNFDGAARAYNQLIDIQDKDVSVIDVAGLTSLTDSYSELAQVYSAQYEPEKATGAFEVAGQLQQVALASRKYQAKASEETTAKLSMQLDRLGDAYVELKRYAQAEETYGAALEIRSSDDAVKKEAWKSYEKLGGMFYDQIKDKAYAANIHDPNYAAAYAKARDNFLLLVGFLGPAPTDPVLKKKYGDALEKLGRLYMNDPSTYDKAETHLTSAVTTFKQLGDWRGEDTALLALIGLYRRQKNEAKVDENYDRLLASMARYIKLYRSNAPSRAGWPGFLPTYVQATKDVGDYFLAQKKNPQAEAAYAEAFAAATLVQQKTTNKKVLSTYLSMLEKYEALLRELKKLEEAEKVKLVAGPLRAKVTALD
jgi:hypothetical protein